jgi:hypothetical protein
MSNSFYYPTISQAEIDQRSRETRLRLEYVEALLVPGITGRPRRVLLFFYRLFRCWWQRSFEA